jgi:hypothetical protein
MRCASNDGGTNDGDQSGLRRSSCSSSSAAIFAGCEPQTLSLPMVDGKAVAGGRNVPQTGPGLHSALQYSPDLALLWQDFMRQGCGLQGWNSQRGASTVSTFIPESTDFTTDASRSRTTTAEVAPTNISVIQQFQVAPNVSPVVDSSARKAFQRKHLSEYMQLQKSPDRIKTHIPTDMNGDITALKLVFHRAVRDIAGRVLDLSVVNFQDHPSICLNYINHDLAKHFVFNPPLRQNYVVEYLKESVSNSRYRWRCYWKQHGTRHPTCPVKRYPALVTYWKTPEAEDESRRMQNARRRRPPARRRGAAGGEEDTEGDDFLGNSSSAQTVGTVRHYLQPI